MGLQTEQFFNKETNGDARWAIKVAEECAVNEKVDAFNCFNDIEDILFHQQGHETGLGLFLDLTKSMLHIDPNTHDPSRSFTAPIVHWKRGKVE